jgi:type IV pilus assembly protein PilV
MRTMRSNPVPMRARRARGFTLVETLVALLALSIGLLGVAGLQLNGLRANQSSAWRSQATYLAYDILDRMRANRANRSDYVVGTSAEEAAADDAAEEAGEPRAARQATAAADLSSWKTNLDNVLPLGDGTISFEGAGNNIVVVTVQWNDTREADGDPLVFTMRSSL